MAFVLRVGLFVVLASIAVAACSNPDADSPDASSPDAGSPDASSPDAGSPDADAVDAAFPDAALSDAASPDAVALDAAVSDALVFDAADAAAFDATTPIDAPPAICGDGVVQPGEACDDGNLVSLDGCSAACTVDVFTEREPNEDGTPMPGGVGTDGNDFDGSGVAVANAIAQGVIHVSDGDTLRLASLVPVGDEDVFAIENDTVHPVSARLDLWNLASGFGVGVVCRSSVNLYFRVRDASGTSLAFSGGRASYSDYCGGRSWLIAPGSTVYIHVVDAGDDSPVGSYALQIAFTSAVCGDGTPFAGLEECDDGNLVSGDGCSATCVVEGVAEREPNEDGTPSSSSAWLGNDFDVGGTLAVNNATAQGRHDAALGPRTWIGAIRVGAAPGTVGDEDVYAVTNSGPTPLDVSADVQDAATGIGNPCPDTTDAAVSVRDAAGAMLGYSASSTTGSCVHLAFSVPPGATRYLHVVDWGDNGVIPKYFLVVSPRPVVCGDGELAAGTEECDDGNTASGDGCGGTCLVEGMSELEPNDDGTPSLGGGTDGNDFDVGGTVAITNATAQGVQDVASGGRRIWLGALSAGISTGLVGDEDVYVVTNSSSSHLSVTADLFRGGTGFDQPCRPTRPTPMETVYLRLRDSAGVILATSSDRDAGDRCSSMTFVLAPGMTRYLHVIDSEDDAIIPRYFLAVEPHAIVCGDGQVIEGVEACDDGNLLGGDGCSASCGIELNAYCGDSPSRCWRIPTTVPLACIDMTGASTLLATGDDVYSQVVPLPFPVPFYGRSQIHFTASADGLARPLANDTPTPTSPWGGASPLSIPSPYVTTDGFLAPFWDNLVLSGPGLLTKPTGSSPNRIFTLEWNAATVTTPTATGLRFQLQFHEGGFVEYHYCSGGGDAARASGSRAAIGAVDLGRRRGYGYAVRLPDAVTPGVTALRWSFIQM